MRASGAFVLGAIMGAAVVWVWGREMKEYAEGKTRETRTKIAEGVQGVEETAEHVLNRGGELLHRIDEFVRDTKEDVGNALRAGREAIRPEHAAKKG